MYDATKDPYAGTLLNFGTRARLIAKHDVDDMASYPLAIEVISSGSLKVLPLKAESDAEAVTYPAVGPGFRPGFRVRRVFATGTSCDVVTIERPA